MKYVYKTFKTIKDWITSIKSVVVSKTAKTAKTAKTLIDKKRNTQKPTSSQLFKDDKESKYDCEFDASCTSKQCWKSCRWNFKLGKEFKEGKKTILLIDDNEGVVSFLKDDLEYFDEEGRIKLSDFNVLCISSKLAAFRYRILQQTHNLNIKYAIIDITIGGSTMTADGNLKLNGVDIYCDMIDKNPDVNFLFYTGNNLNPYIKTNQILIDRFNAKNGDNINKYVLYKTSLDMDSRRKFISTKFGWHKDSKQ